MHIQNKGVHLLQQTTSTMILEAIKSNDNFTRTTEYDCFAPYPNAYFEGKNALKELKQFAKEKGFTELIVHTKYSQKSYKL